MNKALLVIDYSYDFVAPDGKLTAGEPAMAIEGNIAGRIDAAVRDGEFVFFMMDLHFENDTYHPEYKLFPPHNIDGTPGRELYGEVLEKYREIESQENVFFLDKTRYSAFSGTRLHQLLQERRVDTVVLTGVVTDICIMHTAVDAYNLGYDIIVPESCVASFNPEAHTESLKHFQNSLGAVIEP
ncbi:cysteine hydrolase family protein [Salinicoccus halitifaciens]|uniref:Nicotinamidase-related amidase n=1 Tax=Salinicoccus halitifaciens TaxID=1073415 RepID=A0ABV2EB76_9STAP|nr:isochorismatase family cysteine hydrolase [Salinicoccus halitifaciens]MCD2137471.1 cysteine hydrolase [Salinicoccus halitifaciens]